jgi:hypothetical protein
MDELAKHISYIVSECHSSNFAVVEASKEAEDAWVQDIIDHSRYNEEF